MPVEASASPSRSAGWVAKFFARCWWLVRLAVTGVFSAVLGSVVAMALLVAAPPLFGYQSLTVLSGSMVPTLGVGSVILDEQISPLEIRLGDVVTFSSPENRNKLITHRVRHMKVRGTTAFVETRGDANPTSEHWSVPAGGKVGRVLYHVPKLGYARQWVSGVGVRHAIVGLVLALGLWLLIDIWRPQRGEERGETRAEDGEGPITTESGS